MIEGLVEFLRRQTRQRDTESDQDDDRKMGSHRATHFLLGDGQLEIFWGWVLLLLPVAEGLAGESAHPTTGKDRSRNYCPIVAFRSAKDDKKRSNTGKPDSATRLGVHCFIDPSYALIGLARGEQLHPAGEFKRHELLIFRQDR